MFQDPDIELALENNPSFVNVVKKKKNDIDVLSKGAASNLLASVYTSPQGCMRQGGVSYDVLISGLFP